MCVCVCITCSRLFKASYKFFQEHEGGWHPSNQDTREVREKKYKRKVKVKLKGKGKRERMQRKEKGKE